MTKARYRAALVELPGPFGAAGWNMVEGHSLPKIKGWVVFEYGATGPVAVAWAVNKPAAVTIAGALQEMVPGDLPAARAEMEIDGSSS